MRGEYGNPKSGERNPEMSLSIRHLYPQYTVETDSPFLPRFLSGGFFYQCQGGWLIKASVQLYNAWRAT